MTPVSGSQFTVFPELATEELAGGLSSTGPRNQFEVGVVDSLLVGFTMCPTVAAHCASVFVVVANSGDFAVVANSGDVVADGPSRPE